MVKIKFFFLVNDIISCGADPGGCGTTTCSHNTNKSVCVTNTGGCGFKISVCDTNITSCNTIDTIGCSIVISICDTNTNDSGINIHLRH